MQNILFSTPKYLNEIAKLGKQQKFFIFQPIKRNLKGLKLSPLENDTISLSPIAKLKKEYLPYTLEDFWRLQRDMKNQFGHGCMAKGGTDEYNQYYLAGMHKLNGLNEFLRTGHCSDDLAIEYAVRDSGVIKKIIPDKKLRSRYIDDHYLEHEKEAFRQIETEINTAAGKMSLPKNGVFYRGLTETSFIPQAGEIFTEKGLMFVSLEKKMAEGYAAGTNATSFEIYNKYANNPKHKGVVAKIFLPKGTNYLMPASAFEFGNTNGEFCLQSGQKFLVLKNDSSGVELLKI